MLYFRWTFGIGLGFVMVVERDGDATDGTRDSGVVAA